MTDKMSGRRPSLPHAPAGGGTGGHGIKRSVWRPNAGAARACSGQNETGRGAACLFDVRATDDNVTQLTHPQQAVIAVEFIPLAGGGQGEPVSLVSQGVKELMYGPGAAGLAVLDAPHSEPSGTHHRAKRQKARNCHMDSDAPHARPGLFMIRQPNQLNLAQVSTA